MELLIILGFTFILIVFGFRFYFYKTMTKRVCSLDPDSTQPMFIVYGDYEISFIQKMSLKWHAGQADSQLVMINGAHHILNQDNPREFNRELANYLENLGYLRRVAGNEGDSDYNP